jgi:hypothetical protein
MLAIFGKPGHEGSRQPTVLEQASSGGVRVRQVDGRETLDMIKDWL